MMCQSAEDLRNQAGWDGARGESRTHLLSDLSSKQHYTQKPKVDTKSPQDQYRLAS
jgi:hypothetical protein